MQDDEIEWKHFQSLLQKRKTLVLELDKYKHMVMNVTDIIRNWDASSSIKRNNI